MPPPIPPPPPPPVTAKSSASASGPALPTVAATGPPGAFLVELLTYNGYPFKDHWAYFVQSHTDSELGVVIHATGDVRTGFQLEIKRSHNFNLTKNLPLRRIPLQWVGAEYFDEDAMLNFGKRQLDTVPVCGFESSLYRVPAPQKTLNSANDDSAPGKKVVQRNCQTWVVESADRLVRDGIFDKDVADFLVAYKQ